MSWSVICISIKKMESILVGDRRASIWFSAFECGIKIKPNSVLDIGCAYRTNLIKIRSHAPHIKIISIDINS